MDTLWPAVHASRAWLDAANGTDSHQVTCRILKVVEEAGEAAGAWIGVLGNNPRKGITHTVDHVAGELADVVLAALVAMDSLGIDAPTALDKCVQKVMARLQPEQDTFPLGEAVAACDAERS